MNYKIKVLIATEAIRKTKSYKNVLDLFMNKPWKSFGKK